MNTARHGPRSIRVVNGFVEVGGRDTATSQHIPRKVGDLVVWYLWLILLFWQQVNGIVTDSSTKCISSGRKHSVWGREGGQTQRRAKMDRSGRRIKQRQGWSSIASGY